jgi:flagellar hook-basal body complex protein FliE
MAMEISRIGSSLLSSPTLPSVGVKTTQGSSFQNLLGSAIDDLNRVQGNADQAINSLAMGEATDIHDVTIAVQEADIAFELALQVRNKMVEAYQEVMRMQV